MKEIEEYVEKLFSDYGRTKSIDELKEEILTDLEDKVKDYMENGMAYDAAVSKAKDDIKSVDTIIGCNKKIYINRLRYELIQSTLIYFMVAWIITIPLRLNVTGVIINDTMIFAAIIYLLIYIYISNKKDKEFINSVSMVNIKKIKKMNKLAWMLWWLYILIQSGFTTAVKFGSNIWFHRSVKIDGPYQFAVIVLQYGIPFITIIIPVIFNKACSIVNKYEVRDDE